ncbi:MAG: IS4 family transposase [Niameybacter sp.]
MQTAIANELKPMHYLEHVFKQIQLNKDLQISDILPWSASSAVNHTITHFDITSGVTHDSQCLTEMIKQLSKSDLFLADLGYFDTDFLKKLNENNFFISRIKTNLKLYKGVSETYSIYDEIDTVAMLKQSPHSIDKEVYIGNRSDSKLKVRLVGIRLSDAIAHKRIKKAIAQNNGQDISSNKRELLHWNLMVTNIKSDRLSATIITELYRIHWQIELLFKVLKSTLSIDKMHVGKTKYVETILYGRLVGTLITMPLYDYLDHSLLLSKGRGVSLQRFYTLLIVNLYQFYTVKQITVHTYLELGRLLERIGTLALQEKRKRQTTFSRIESYLEGLTCFGKT